MQNSTSNKRIKTVFSDISAIAHLWANQSQDNARNSGNGNFYFNGDTIYSYGRHFPIARITENKAKDKTIFTDREICFFTLRTYSNTTAKHISVTRQASSHKDRLYMANIPLNDMDIDNDFHNCNLDVWRNSIEANLKKLLTARKKEIYYAEISRIQAEMKRYISYFSVKVDKKTKLLLQDVTSSNDAIEYIKKEEVRIKADRVKRENQAKKLFAESLTKFRSGEINRLQTNQSGFDYLRYNVNKDQFETSQDINIPAVIGLRFYNNCILSTCNECTTFLGYPVKEITKDYVHVGCHKISIEEINNVVKTYEKAQTTLHKVA